jgi:hypothetical protein
MLTLLFPAFGILEQLVKEANSREMGVEMDSLVDGMVVEKMVHGGRSEAVDVG